MLRRLFPRISDLFILLVAAAAMVVWLSSKLR